MAENKKYFYWIIMILIIISIIYIIYPKPKTDKTTAECIGKNSIIYISTGCSACAVQEKLFGDNFKYLNTVDCAIEPEKCKAALITTVPTWIINQEKFVGVQQISTLKDLTGC